MSKQQQSEMAKAADRLEIWMNGNDEMRWAEVSIGQHRRWCVRLFEIQVDGKCFARAEGEGPTLEDAIDGALDQLPHADPVAVRVRTIEPAPAYVPDPEGFCLRSGGREIVRITADGLVVVNSALTFDEAALRFWLAVQRYAAER